MADRIQPTKQEEAASTPTDASTGSTSWAEEEIDGSDNDSTQIMTGHLAETKDLYAKEDQAGNISWTDKHPDDVEEAAENANTLKYAVIVQKSKSCPTTKHDMS